VPRSFEIAIICEATFDTIDENFVDPSAAFSPY
jgi:hypothetical protein